MATQPTCKQRWAKEKNSDIATIRQLWRAYREGEDSAYSRRIAERIGTFTEHGLSFDYVAPGTFTDQREGYWRYQISWGGPSDEFRFYSSSPSVDPYRIEYCFMDWGDGYCRKLTGKDEELLTEIWQFFAEVESTQSEYDKAMADA